MQQLHISHCTVRFYNCTNCDQVHVKICPDQSQFQQISFSSIPLQCRQHLFHQSEIDNPSCI